MNVRFAAAVATHCLAALPAAAIFVFVPPTPVTVTELHNAITGHYFLTLSRAELADIDAGKAGPGWSRTGLGFQAYLPQSDSAPDCFDEECGVAVARFYGPGPNSHFFTASAGEAEILARPGTGWLREGVAFHIPVPDAMGRCLPGYVPVVRLYNDRFGFNDSNHRYVTREDERAAMRARGWIDEGVAFCSTGAVQVPR